MFHVKILNIISIHLMPPICIERRETEQINSVNFSTRLNINLEMTWDPV
jgi:hypothetical protein